MWVWDVWVVFGLWVVLGVCQCYMSPSMQPLQHVSLNIANTCSDHCARHIPLKSPMHALHIFLHHTHTHTLSNSCATVLAKSPALPQAMTTRGVGIDHLPSNHLTEHQCLKVWPSGSLWSNLCNCKASKALMALPSWSKVTMLNDMPLLVSVTCVCECSPRQCVQTLGSRFITLALLVF